jgi:predicted NUDIX family NTP pyrophosphohydrolase
MARSKRTSAGILLYRRHGDRLEVLLAHPGGPLFAQRDEGAWTIPKGEVEEGDDSAPDDERLLATALREMREETGIEARGPFVALGSITQKGGKVVHAWACAGDCDPASIRSNTFEMEWPPHSGRRQRFPEVDRAEFFAVAAAAAKIKPAQRELIDRLVLALGRS